jgi:hypothetical protein
MSRHPVTCQCLGTVGEATDGALAATGRQGIAILSARDHGASLRQIGEAAGISHDYVRTICAARGGEPPRLAERHAAGPDSVADAPEPPSEPAAPGPPGGLLGADGKPIPSEAGYSLADPEPASGLMGLIPPGGSLG